MTSLNAPTVITDDADIRLSSHNIIGGYFENNPDIYLNSLPGSAEPQYVNIKNMVTGTSLDCASVRMQAYKPLLGIGLYGESHALWLEDESALLFGPTAVDSFQKNIETVRSGSDVLGSTIYTTTLDISIEYNCLISLSYYSFAQLEDEGSGLGSYVRYVEDEIPEEEFEHTWNLSGTRIMPDEDEPGVITYSDAKYPLFLRTERFVFYALESEDNSEWIVGCSDPLKVKAGRKPLNDTAMKYFRCVLVDGAEVDEKHYDLESGSVILSLKASYLKNLSAGRHRLTIEFFDGLVETSFTIRNRKKSGAETPAYRFPLTGIE